MSKARSLIVMRNELREQIASATQDGGQHTDVTCLVTQHFEKIEGRPSHLSACNVFMLQCNGCGKTGLVPLGPEATIFFGYFLPVVMSADLVDRFEVWCRNTLIPHAQHFAESRCFTYAARAEVAQWVTEQVRDAGPEGVSEWELIRLSEETRRCPPRDLDDVLDTLNKGGAWSAEDRDRRMRLPVGHPYRSW